MQKNAVNGKGVSNLAINKVTQAKVSVESKVTVWDAKYKQKSFWFELQMNMTEEAQKYVQTLTKISRAFQLQNFEFLGDKNLLTIKGSIPDLGDTIDLKDKMELLGQFLTTKLELEADPTVASTPIAAILEKGTTVSHEWNLPTDLQESMGLKSDNSQLKDVKQLE